MLLYRVEDKRNLGPYHWAMPDDVNSQAIRKSVKLHPNPIYDNISLHRAEGREKFAFASLADLRKWFKPAGKRWVKAAAKAGLMVSILQTRPAQIGGHQVTFNQRGAKRIARLPLEDVLK